MTNWYAVVSNGLALKAADSAQRALSLHERSMFAAKRAETRQTAEERMREGKIALDLFTEAEILRKEALTFLEKARALAHRSSNA
jgi:hypothetical protein